MDIKTLIISLIFLNLSLGSFMLLFVRIQKTYPGFIYWGLSTLLVSLCLFLISLRGVIHDFLSIVIANSLIFIIGILRIVGVRKFFGKKELNASFIIALVMLFLLTFFSFIFFTYANNNINIRIAISTAFTGAVSIYLSFLVFKNVPQFGKLSYMVTGVIFLIYAVFSFLRGYERTVLLNTNTLYDATLFNGLYFSFSIIFDVAWTTLFLIINNQRLGNELTEKNNELTELNKIKDRFFAIIAHDLKNPFNGIIGISNLLLENLETKEMNKIEELLKMIRNTAEQAYALLGNLLSWAKTQIRSVVFKPGSFNLGEIIKRNIAQAKTSADSKEIQFKNHIDDALMVFVDKDMLDAVVRNLLTNAIKFSHPKSEIILDARESDTDVTLSVKDFGLGISATDIRKLFKPGEIVAGKGTNGEEGSGIGLLLCKEYININSGKIWIDSQIGKGSTFHVSLKKSE
jgi:two-component system, sensor histidine kinase and response regulator